MTRPLLLLGLAACGLGTAFGLARKAFPGRPIVLDCASDQYASEFVIFSTDSGIYRFDRSTATWARVVPGAYAGSRVNVLGVDEGVLWVGAEAGPASADLRISDWQTCELGGAVSGLAFDDRYVWAAGEFGLSRFDKYAETWQGVYGRKVNDVFLDKAYLWLATDSGVLRYSREFERVEPVPAPALGYERIVGTPKRTWFFGPGRWAVLNRDTESWSRGEWPGLEDVAALGDSLFAVSTGAVVRYDPGSDNWLPFRDIEGLAGVSGVSAAGSRIAFALDDGLVAYNRSERSQKTYSRASGLVEESLLAVHEDSRFIFAVGPGYIQVLDRGTGIWQAERLSAAGKPGRRVLYLDDAGAHLGLIPDTDVRLSGRAHYSDLRSFGAGPATSYENVNLSLGVRHATGRNVSLYYDDSDRKQTMYGLSYRGAGRDVLDRADAGQLKTEYFEFGLVPRFATLGGSARLRALGQGVGLQAGRVQSSPRADFFSGRTADKAARIRDVDYSRGTFYRVPAPVAGYDTVFVDDRSPATNTIATRVGFTAGGIFGDFDPLINGRDYFRAEGFVHFLSARKPADIIVLRHGGGDMVLQSDSVAAGSENAYYFGPDIVPGSFELAITDTAGRVCDLGEFGLDEDRDGMVDPQFVNHDLGWLVFPEARPFPEPVYTESVHVYTMDARFRTEARFYYLAHAPVERNSEQVLVDGEPAGRGSDYLVDYSSGVLLFLREDIVSEFSQVEVRYSSVERDRQDWTYSCQPVLGITDGVTVAPGFTGVGEERVVHLSARAEAGNGDRSVKFVPQVAMDLDRNLAHDYSLVANYGVASLSGRYQGYGEGFESFGAGLRRYGELRHAGSLGLGLEPVPGLRLDTRFQDELQADSAGRKSCRYVSGKAGFQRAGLPGGYLLAGKDDLPDEEKLRLKAGANCELAALGSRLRLNGTVQHVGSDPAGAERNRSFEYIGDAVFSLPGPVHGSFWFRHNDVTGGREQEEQEIRARLNADAIPGLYYSGNYRILTRGDELPGVRDLSLAGYLYNDLNIAPGRWLPGASIVNLSVGTGGSFNQYLGNAAPDYRVPVFVFRPVEDAPVSSMDNSVTSYGAVQLDPLSGLTVRARRGLTRVGRAYYGLPVLRPTVEDEVKVEYEPERLGMFTALWNRRDSRAYPATLLDNLYFEWNKPWVEALRTKLTAGYRVDRERYPTVASQGSELRASLQTLYRFSARSYATLDLGASRESKVQNPESEVSLLPGLGLNLNLLRFLYIQVSYQSSVPMSGGTTHTLSTRLTGQF